MSAREHERYLFGDFELNCYRGTLCRGGVPVKIPPQPLKMLAMILERPGQIVSREELRGRIWGDVTFVEFDQGLNYCIRRIRIALEDNTAKPVYLETLPKQGYRFIAPVRRSAAGEAHGVSFEAGGGEAQSSTGSIFRRRRTFFITVAALFAISAAGWGGYKHWKHSTKESLEGTSVVVLPLTNKTGDPALDYLADAATSDIIRRLSRIPGLKVIGQTSSMAMKGRDVASAEASRKFGVRAVVSGSIQREGAEFVMDLEAADGRDGSVILSRLYRQNGTNPAIMQPAIVEDVARSLHLRLRSEDWKKLADEPTRNGEAANLYLKAEALIANNDPPALQEAARLLSSAVERDSHFALALSELAAVHAMLGLYFEDPRQHMPEAKRLAVRALEIDDSLKEAQGTLGVIALTYDWDSRESERRLILASGRMNPTAVTQLGCTTHLMASSGRLDKSAEEEVRLALAANPLSVGLTAELGCCAYYARQYERAVHGYNQALAMKPDDVVALWGLGKSYSQLGDYQKALEALQHAPKPRGQYPPPIIGEMGYAYARKGDRAAAHAMLSELGSIGQKSFVDPCFRAQIHLALAETDAALHALEDAYNRRSTLLVSIYSDPKWDSLRQNPRFRDLLRRIGL
jgi:DNA-binding winged helix-turn-helix (wHTH) protein/TolB-like protein/lipopolysaccharide biosynthesis regulator YciM